MSGSGIMYQADANLDIDIVFGLRRLQPDIDFQTADDANLRGVADPEVLAIAARQGRILVSHDRRTMPTHFSTLLMSGQHSAGVILLPQEGSIREARGID